MGIRRARMQVLHHVLPTGDSEPDALCVLNLASARPGNSVLPLALDGSPRLRRSNSNSSLLSTASTFTRTTQFSVTVLLAIARGARTPTVFFAPQLPSHSLHCPSAQVQVPDEALTEPVFYQVSVSNCHRGTEWRLSRRYQAFDSVHSHLRFWRRAPDGLELPPKHPKPGLDPARIAERAAGLQAWAAEVLSSDSALREAKVIAFFSLPRVCDEAELAEAEAALLRIQAAVRGQRSRQSCVEMRKERVLMTSKATPSAVRLFLLLLLLLFPPLVAALLQAQPAWLTAITPVAVARAPTAGPPSPLRRVIKRNLLLELPSLLSGWAGRK